MAFSSKFINVVFVVGLCLLVIHEAFGCNTGDRCFYAKAASEEIQSRKVLASMEGKKKEGFNGGVHLHGSSSSGNGGSLVGWELRKVPSGPDPLHHNGGSPKKPRTP